MAVSITVLASGSNGNCTLVSSSATRLLVDAGLSCRELMRRMKLCGEDPRSIDAILITHEHGDHVAGLHVLAKKLKVPVYITGATHDSYRRWARDSAGNKVTLERLECFASGRAFQIGDVTVMPFTIPHDAVDPVGFTFVSEGIKVGICTDLGYMPAERAPSSARLPDADDRVEPRSGAAARRPISVVGEAAGDEPRRSSVE